LSNLANIQAVIYENFGELELLPWVVAAFSLGHGSSSLLFKQIIKHTSTDVKTLSVISWLISTVGNVLCGAASNIQMVIGGRILIGIGLSGVYSCALVYNTLLPTPSEQSRLSGIIGAGFAAGLLAGPFVGAGFAENSGASWRWAFYICLPWTGIIMVMTQLAYPTLRLSPNTTFLAGIMNIDWVGYFLQLAALALLDSALIFSGSTFEWNSAGAIATWTLGGLTFILYILQQRYSIFTPPERRLFPVSLTSTRLGLLCCIATACAATTHGICLYYTPLYFAFAQGDGPITSATHMLPLFGTFVFLALLVGIVLPRIRFYPAIYLLGAICIIASCAGLLSVNHGTSSTIAMGLTGLTGIGTGMSFQLAVTVFNVALPVHQRIDASILVSFSQIGTQTILLSVAGSIYQNEGFRRLRDALPISQFSDFDIREALAGHRSVVFQTASRVQADLVLSIITDVIIRIFAIGIAAGAVMLISAALLKWEPLDFGPKKPESDQETVSQRLERAGEGE
jgi:MFS family permease